MNKIQIIPKIHIKDKLSYIEKSVICVKIDELQTKRIYNDVLLASDYFRAKKIIWSSVISDESIHDYIDYLSYLSIDQEIQKNNFFLSADGPVYDDMDDFERADELALIDDMNQKLASLIPNEKNIICLLKGSTVNEYALSYENLQRTFPNTTKYCMYLSGPIRSNPGHFNALKFLQEKIPFFKDEKHQLYLYGCNPKSALMIHELQTEFNVVGIISESHLADAKYRGNPRYTRQTTIQKAWEKYQGLFIH